MMNFLSLGAGVQSSTLALMAAKGIIKPMPDAAIFADTGWESDEVMENLDSLINKLPYPVHIVQNRNLKDDLETFVKEKTFIPIPFNTETESGKSGFLRRQCTREYKIEPITKKIKELCGIKKGCRALGKIEVNLWIGISLDEINRMKPNRTKWINNVWPLIDKRMTRSDCLNWFDSQGYKRPVKSSCIPCPYHNDLDWRNMKLNHPDQWQEALRVDRLIRNGTRGTKEKLFIHQSLKPLEEVDLETLEDKGQLNMFDDECEGMCGV
jgi:hypothetical protein